MFVVYVGPEQRDEIEVDGYGLVKPGEATDIPDHIAGRVPSGHPADGDAYDPGAGLLAQPVNWQPAKAPKAPKAPADPKPEEG